MRIALWVASPERFQVGLWIYGYPDELRLPHYSQLPLLHLQLPPHSSSSTTTPPRSATYSLTSCHNEYIISRDRFPLIHSCPHIQTHSHTSQNASYVTSRALRLSEIVYVSDLARSNQVILLKIDDGYVEVA